MQCPSCGIALFPSKQTAEEVSPTIALWEGDHPDFYQSLMDDLAEAGIPRLGEERTAVYFGPLGVPRFSVRVLEADAARARGVMEQEAAGYEVDEHAALGIQRTARPVGSTPQDIFGEWREEDRAVEAWSGADAPLAKSLCACLRENEIAYRTEPASDSAVRILVHPQDQPQAREIIREVVEAAPPA